MNFKYHKGKATWRTEYIPAENIFPCCYEMNEALDKESVHFGEIDDYATINPVLNISVCKPYPEGAVWDDYEINFCPFCGEKIILEEVENEPKRQVEANKRKPKAHKGK